MNHRIVMTGATGAVGRQVVRALLDLPDVTQITLLGRRPLLDFDDARIGQHEIDVFDASSYQVHLEGHTAAICTLGVGEATSVSREEFRRVDYTAALAFGSACKAAGIEHFSLLSSVGASATSRSWYLRTKGELERDLIALEFDRLSLFQPSMIITPENRYGLSQGIILKVWPVISPLMLGPTRKFRGVRVAELGQVMANNIAIRQCGVEILEWPEFQRLLSSRPVAS